MRLLSLDTSTAALSVALVADGAVVAAVRREVGTGHGEQLAPAVREVLAAAPGRLDAVLVGLGPGPFTSLRVGIATAAAFADASGVPVLGACSLDLLAAPGVVVAQDARRREAYWARYDGRARRVEGPAVEAREALAARLAPEQVVVGAGAVLLGRPEPAPELRWPPAERLAGLLGPRLAEVLAGAPAGPLVPLYLRRPDAEAVAAGAAPRLAVP